MGVEGNVCVQTICWMEFVFVVSPSGHAQHIQALQRKYSIYIYIERERERERERETDRQRERERESTSIYHPMAEQKWGYIKVLAMIPYFKFNFFQHLLIFFAVLETPPMY